MKSDGQKEESNGEEDGEEDGTFNVEEVEDEVESNDHLIEESESEEIII